MLRSLSRVLRLLVLVGAMSLPATPATQQSSDLPAEMAATPLVIRKLHLVRPDLIFYPIHLEVVC